MARLEGGVELEQRRSSGFVANRKAWQEAAAALEADRAKIQEGGGARAAERQHAKNRLTARERVRLLLDEGAAFWMRTREVMVHAVDLGTGVTFADLPAEFNAALVDDIVAKRGSALAGSGSPAVRVTTNDSTQATWEVPGEGEPTTVTGSLASVTAWLAGRSADGVSTTDGAPLPTLPAWL